MSKLYENVEYTLTNAMCLYLEEMHKAKDSGDDATAETMRTKFITVWHVLRDMTGRYLNGEDDAVASLNIAIGSRIDGYFKAATDAANDNNGSLTMMYLNKIETLNSVHTDALACCIYELEG